MTRLGSERRRPIWYQYIFQFVVPGLILGMVTWTTGTVADLKIDMALAAAHARSIDNTLAGLREEFHRELYNHSEETRKWAARNAIDHHREMMTPCNRCHTNGHKSKVMPK